MVLRAGFHGTVGQPSAQVIDGSLKFDTNQSDHLRRTPGSAGNRKTWTWINWMKKTLMLALMMYCLLLVQEQTPKTDLSLNSGGDQSLEIGQDVSGTFTLFRKTSQSFP